MADVVHPCRRQLKRLRGFLGVRGYESGISSRAEGGSGYQNSGADPASISGILIITPC
jgi:hypothetical protein